MLKSLERIGVPRQAQGRRWALAPLLAISVLAVLTGANSYREIVRCNDAHRPELNEGGGAPVEAGTGSHGHYLVFVRLSHEAVHAAFQARSAALAKEGAPENCPASDGKALKGSFVAEHCFKTFGVA